jgi:Ku protein
MGRPQYSLIKARLHGGQVDAETSPNSGRGDFVPASEIPWTYFESAYYVEPTKPGFRAYALLREALKESGRVGIGSVVLRQREHLAALASSGDVLLLAMMKFAQELRSPDELTLPRDVAVDPRELQAPQRASSITRRTRLMRSQGCQRRASVLATSSS